MPTLDGLPSEVRRLIYEYLVAGQNLRYHPPALHDMRSETRPLLPITSILYVCRRSLREARPTLIKTATIYLDRVGDTVTLTHRAVIDTEFFSTISHIRMSWPVPGHYISVIFAI